MKYEEIKIGDVFICKIRDVFICKDYVETVISKSDKYRIITTIDSDNTPTAWEEDELERLKPVKEELPEEGLLVSVLDSLIYKLSDGSGYGFIRGNQSGYIFNNRWNFHTDGHWKPATPEQKKKFVEMLKIECEKCGLFEDTKLTECGINSGGAVNKGFYDAVFTSHTAWNKNGKIFYRGKFATPRKEITLELVSKAVKDIGDFTIEQTESGVIILTPIKNKQK